MVKNSQDELIRAYAMLKSLRKNIGDMKEYSIKETYVDEFHSVLNRLEGTDIDVSEFRILDSLVKPRVTSSWRGLDGRGGKSYSEEKYVERTYILTKIDAVLGYFEIIMSPEQKRIGFHKSED